MDQFLIHNMLPHRPPMHDFEVKQLHANNRQAVFGTHDVWKCQWHFHNMPTTCKLHFQQMAIINSNSIDCQWQVNPCKFDVMQSKEINKTDQIHTYFTQIKIFSNFKVKLWTIFILLNSIITLLSQMLDYWIHQEPIQWLDGPILRHKIYLVWSVIEAINDKVCYSCLLESMARLRKEMR